MELSELEPKLKVTQDELIVHREKTQKFKEYVQDLFIDVYTQDEFKRRVDAIFYETFKRDQLGVSKWHGLTLAEYDAKTDAEKEATFRDSE